MTKSPPFTLIGSVAFAQGSTVFALTVKFLTFDSLLVEVLITLTVLNPIFLTKSAGILATSLFPETSFGVI